MNPQIEYISIDLLKHHPDNPRKDIGDLTELTDSIKKSGIMQNLTVVPEETYKQYRSDGSAVPKTGETSYLVVIGNRRLEAAKKAGLTELPCIVSDMAYSEQLSTMLVENMQRSDLTVYEQAQGFQMLLDLDYSVEQIAEKSGFSEGTVRKRVKLLELDKEKFKKAQQRGATLFDYELLNKIKDPDVKNELLGILGTKDFQLKYRRALGEQETKEAVALMTAQADKFATHDESITYNTPGRKFYKSYTVRKGCEVEAPKDSDEVKYFYKISSYSLDIYKEVSEEEQKNERKADDDFWAKQDRVRKKFDKFAEETYSIRSRFAADVTDSEAKEQIGELMKALFFCQEYKGEYYNDRCTFSKYTFSDVEGIKFDQDKALLENEEFVGHCDKTPYRTIFRYVYAHLDNDDLSYSRNFYIRTEPPVQYACNRVLDAVYRLLLLFGYEMSTEEEQMKDGTHKLFKEAEKAIGKE